MALTVAIQVFHFDEHIGSLEFFWSRPEEWLMESLSVVVEDDFIKRQIEDVIFNNRFEISVSGGLFPQNLSQYYEGTQYALSLLSSEFEGDLRFVFPDAEEMPTLVEQEGAHL